MLGNPTGMSTPSIFTAVAFIKGHQRVNGAFNLFHYQFSDDSTQLLATAQPTTSIPISDIPDVPEHAAPPSTAPTTHLTSSTAISITPDVPKRAAPPSSAPQLVESAPPTTSIVPVAAWEVPQEPPTSDDVETMAAPTTTPTSVAPNTEPNPTQPGLTAVAPSVQTPLVVGNPVKSKKRPSAGKISAAPTTKHRKIDQAPVSAP